MTCFLKLHSGICFKITTAQRKCLNNNPVSHVPSIWWVLTPELSNNSSGFFDWWLREWRGGWQLSVAEWALVLSKTSPFSFVVLPHTFSNLHNIMQCILNNHKRNCTLDGCSPFCWLLMALYMYIQGKKTLEIYILSWGTSLGCSYAVNEQLTNAHSVGSSDIHIDLQTV